MRVLVVSNQLTRDQSSLWETVSKEREIDVHLAGGPPRSGFEVYDPSAELPELPTYVLRPIRMRNRSDHSWWLYGGLSEAAERIRPDLIHLNGELWALNAGQVLRLHRRTIVHGADNQFSFGPPVERKLRMMLLRRNLARLVGYVSWNAEGCALAEGLRPDLNTLVCPAIAVPTGNYRRPRRRDELSIGFVGRVSSAKGIHTLLRAHRIMRGERSRHRLTVIGWGNSGDQLAREYVDVDWRGVLAHDEVMAELREIDVLVVPSVDTARWKEQYCRAAVEAMSMGVPVVHSGSGALPEVVGEGGTVFVQGDANSLAEVLIGLDEQRLTAMSLLARREYEKRHDPSVLAPRLATFWKERIDS